MDATLAKAIFFGLVAVGAGVAVGAAAAGGGVGFGASARGMMEGMARNPNLENKLRLYFFIGLAFAETAILYGLLIALILLFTGVLSSKAGF